MISTAERSTICAISTPPGIGGIAVVRISGPEAIAIADKIWRGKKLADVASHTAHLGLIVDSHGEVIDNGVATVFRAPHSYTGDDVVELSIHGSQWLQSELLRVLIDHGARMAEPGEFTRRAFASGHLDLAQAEAVADVIASQSRAAHRLAMNQMRGHFSSRLAQMRDKLLQLASLLELELDFSEEDVEFASRQQLIGLAQDTLVMVRALADSFASGQAIKNGIPVAIVGATNVGKSTILNALLHDERAIVSPIHGTTRDVIEDTMMVQGTLFRFIDTAGLRDTADTIERIGIERALQRVANANIVLWVSTPQSSPDQLTQELQLLKQNLQPDTPVIHVVNKIDLNPEYQPKIPVIDNINTPPVYIAASIDQNIDALRQRIVDVASLHTLSQSADLAVTNVRHYEALSSAAEAITRVVDGLAASLSGDFVAQDLREAIHYLGEITGEISTPEILTSIFTRFCIGK